MPRIFRPNPLRLSDSYKDTHFYEDEVTELLAYFESRGGEYPYTEFFGLQGILMEHFEGQFFTQADLDEQYANSQQHFYQGFPYKKDGWQYILDKYQGRLPVEIRAVKEGMIMPIHNALFTIKSLDSKVPWIEQWMETVLQHTWYPTVVATKSRICYEEYKRWYDLTSDNPQAINFCLHDFGFRGATGTQAAARGGAAHLLNFRGTDTQIAMDYLHQYYGAPLVTAYSVPATEHSIMTIKGEAGEADMVAAAMRKYPKGIISLVGDSYNIYNFAKEILIGRFRNEIMNRDGKVVCRPDSGDPVTQVPELLDIFAEGFGFSENSKHYKVLAPCIGLLWGDGMDLYSIKAQNRAICEQHRYSIENIVNGMGGGLLQKVNRDTQKVAIKLCNAIIGGKSTPISKKPKSDLAKSSKAGILAVLKQDAGRYVTMERQQRETPFDILEPVFNTGDMKRIMTYDEIVKIAEETAAEYRESLEYATA